MGTPSAMDIRDARVVGIAEYLVCVDTGSTLVTYSLGSCVGVTLVDPVARVGGMLHAMLPLSTSDPDRAVQEPGRFADTGTLTLLSAMFKRGASRSNIVAKVAGAASQVEKGDMFRIGERNLTVVRRVLWKNDILIAAEDCGGSISRTLVLEMTTGRTLVRSNGEINEL